MVLVRMYWDREEEPWNPTYGLELLQTGLLGPDGPPEDACGFQVGPVSAPLQWWFGEAGREGTAFRQGSLEYASWGDGVPDAIPGQPLVARGPVAACRGSGEFEFQTPLTAVGPLGGNAPVIHGAGSLSVEVAALDDIEWLDTSGNPTTWPPQEPDSNEPRIWPTPGEFLDPEAVEAAWVVVCVVDQATGEKTCHAEANRGRAREGPTGGPVLTVAPPTPRSVSLIPRVTRLPGRGRGPADLTAVGPVRGPTVVTCPTEITLSAAFRRAPGFPPGGMRVVYRFAIEDDGILIGHSTAFSVIVPDSRDAYVDTCTTTFQFPQAIDLSRLSGPRLDLDITARPSGPNGDEPGGGRPFPTGSFTAPADRHHRLRIVTELVNTQEVLRSEPAEMELVCE
jgi:hypothetical protein